MIKKSALALAACLLCSGVSVSAENWVQDAGSKQFFIDTDSYRRNGHISSLNIRMDYPDGSIYSTVEFDTAKTLWRIADVITRDKAGNVSRSEQKKAADAGWNEIIPGTFGKSLYQHYVLTDMPDLENIHPLPVYTDVVSGSSFSIDRDSASYKNGYAEFWLIASYRKGNQPLYSVIYRVKMNMAYKKVMTLSATEYDPSGKIKLHAAGNGKWSDIPTDTPVEKVFFYLKDEVDNGRL